MTTLDDMFLLVKEIRDVLIDGLEERQAVEVATPAEPAKVVTLNFDTTPVKVVSVNTKPYMFDPDPDEPLTPTWYQREYEREVARRESMTVERDAIKSERDQWQREAERVRLELRKCRQET